MMVEQIKTEDEYRQCLADVDRLMNTVADDGSVERLQYDLLKMRIVEYDLLAEVERLRGEVESAKKRNVHLLHAQDALRAEVERLRKNLTCHSYDIVKLDDPRATPIPVTLLDNEDEVVVYLNCTTFLDFVEHQGEVRHDMRDAARRGKRIYALGRQGRYIIDDRDNPKYKTVKHRLSWTFDMNPPAPVHPDPALSPVTEDTAKEVGKVRCSPSGRPQDTVKGGE